MTPFAISIGANLGDRIGALQGAVDALVAAESVRVTGVSAVFETDPVGGPSQPDYLNAVVVGETDLRPHELLDLAHRIEQQWDRTREVRWGARTLDIDIVMMGEASVSDATLQIPHPRVAERAFVLVPLSDVDPQAMIGGQRVADLVSRLDCTGVRPSALQLRLREQA